MTAIFHHLLNLWDGIISLQAIDHFWSCRNAPYLRPFSTLGCFSVTVKGERIFGWDSHRDPAGKTWKLHGMISLGKRNFPFAITHRRRKAFYCPASGFALSSSEWFRKFSYRTQSHLSTYCKWFAVFTDSHPNFLFPSSPLSLAPPPKKEKIPAQNEIQNASPPSRSWSFRAQHIAVVAVVGRESPDPPRPRPKACKVNEEKRKRHSGLVGKKIGQGLL